MEILDGVHRLDGIRGANCYFIVAGKDAYLIDTGMPGNALKIIDQIGKLRREPGEIRILISHPDIDHVGSLAALKRLTRAAVAVHEDDAPALAGERSPRKAHGLPGLFLRGVMKVMPNEPVRADLLLKDGDTVGPFKIIHTPGHTDGSICFYDAEKSVLFAGDALRTNKAGDPVISSQVMNSDHLRAVASLKKLVNLDFKILAPGHGQPLCQDASVKVAALAGSGSYHT